MIVEKAEPATAQEPLAAFQPAGQGGEEAAGGKGQGFGPLDPGRQFQTAGEVFGEDEGRAGIGHFAPGPQDFVHRGTADAAAQAGPGEAAQIAQGSDPVGGEPLPHFRRPGGNGNGQGGQGGPAGFRIGPRGVQAPPGQPAGAQGSRRRRPGDRIALLPTAGEGGGGQGLQAAEQAQAAADFQQQSRRRCQTDLGREAAGPAGQGFQGCSLAVFLPFPDGKAGGQSKGGGQALAGPDSGRLGGRVYPQDAAADGNGARRRPEGQGFEGQPGEMEGEPEHGTAFPGGADPGSGSGRPRGRGA